MNPRKRTFAAVELLLIAPGVLFFTALFVRNLQPQQYEPARTAQRIVSWYAARPHFALWLLLIALPAAVLVMGGATTPVCAWRRGRRSRRPASTSPRCSSPGRRRCPPPCSRSWRCTS